MATFTSFLNLRKPEEGVDYMRASLDLDAPYDQIDAFAALIANPDRGKLIQSAQTSLATNSTPHKLVFDTVRYNYGGVADLSNSRLTAHDNETYHITASVIGPQISGSAQENELRLSPNGDTSDGALLTRAVTFGSNFFTYLNFDWEGELSAGTYVELYAASNSNSGQQNWQLASMSIRRVSFVNL